MFEGVRGAAELIRKHRNDSIELVSHMDSDGVCAAAIVSKSLDRQGIEHRVKFVRMLYWDVVEQLRPADLTIFTDLGGSQLGNLGSRYSSSDVIICDHHRPELAEGWPGLVHLNAHSWGLDGATELSGAGMAYVLARELSQANADLSALAIVGAVGDVQNAWGRLRGYNRRILEEGIAARELGCQTDLQLYGRYTRPIFKSLDTFADPPISGVTGSVEGCMALLKDLRIKPRDEKGWRRLADLTEAERRRLATELIGRAFAHVPGELARYVPGLIIGECYTLLGEAERSVLRDAGEFATSMNSTARHEQPLIGLEVAKGDRGVYYRAMLNLLRHHRRCIAEGMGFVERGGIELGAKNYLQYFDATGVVKETFVGTIAGLSLGSGACDPYKPIAGIVRERGVAKVSARCSKLLFLRGLDLAGAIREGARAVGGEGGGHAVACGAQVEETRVPEFLEKFENLLICQLN